MTQIATIPLILLLKHYFYINNIYVCLQDAAGDTNDREVKSDKSDDYFENDKVTNKSDKQEGEKYGDKVDSVYLRPPPAHKARSNASTVEEEDCGIRCLYYTLQCCDCVLM